MKKTYYFQHDYNARNDPKLQALIVEMGVAGIGIYWCLVEMLYEQDGEMPISSIKSIAYNLHVKQKTVEHVIKDFGLFDYDDDKSENVEKSPKMFRNKSVLKRLNRIIDISEKRKRAIETRWKSKRDSESNEYKCNTNECENDTNEVQTEYKSNTPIIKEKEIKGNEIKEDYKEEGSSLRSEPLSTGAVDVPVKVENYRSDEERKNREYCMAIALFFNQSVQGKQIPQIKKLQKDRMSTILARRKEFGEEAIKEVIIKAAGSRFLNGDNDKGFFATFTWIFKPRNFQKIYEGNYDNRECCATTRQSTTRAQRDAEFAEYARKKMFSDDQTDKLPFSVQDG